MTNKQTNKQTTSWTNSLAKDNISNNIYKGDSMWNSKVGFTTPVRNFFTVCTAEHFVVNNHVDQYIRNSFPLKIIFLFIANITQNTV
jgi:hypothetical protein